MKRKFQIHVEWDSDYEVEVTDEEAEEYGASPEKMAEEIAIDWFQECYPRVTVKEVK